MQRRQSIKGVEQGLRFAVFGVQIRRQLQRRRCVGCSAVGGAGQRLQGITHQHFGGVFLIGLAFDFGATEQKHHATWRTNHAVETRRRFALPVRPDDQITSGLIAGGAGADVIEVVGAQVDQLEAVVAILDRRHLQHHRLGAQVEQGAGVEGVVVRRDDFVVLRAEQTRFAVEAIERQFGIDRGEHFVVFDGGVGEDVSLLCEGFGLAHIKVSGVTGAEAGADR